MPVTNQDIGTEREPTTRETTDDARQGVSAHRVRYMLGFGLAGVIVAFAIIYAVLVGFA